MIPTLYEPFRHWSDGGSVYILSDLHFDDEDCKFMSSDWITPEYIKDIKTRQKILVLGNHDAKGAYNNYFDKIYTGPLFIAEKILLSHEPVYGLPWCLNIHGHDHSNVEPYKEGCKHINLAAKALDPTYNRMQWAGEEYLLEIADLCAAERFKKAITHVEGIRRELEKSL